MQIPSIKNVDISIDAKASRATIEIVPQKNWLTIAFMAVWLVGWGCAVPFALDVLNNRESWFLGLLAAYWIYIGLVIIRRLAYLLLGAEVISFEKSELLLYKKMAFMLSPKRFDLSKPDNFKVSKTLRPSGTRPYNLNMGLGKAGRLQFTYEGKAFFMANVENDNDAIILLDFLAEAKLLQAGQ